jgi:hypothetical protein
MSIIQPIISFLIGVAFGFASALALVPAFAAFLPSSGEANGAAWGLLAVIIGSGLLAAFAPTIRRAFGRGFLLLGACLWALPVSTFLLSGRAASEVVMATDADSQVFAALGAGVAGVAFTGVATFFGLILGSIAVIAGLVLCLGGRREVVVVGGYSPRVPEAAFGAALRREPPMMGPKDQTPQGPRLGGVRR